MKKVALCTLILATTPALVAMDNNSSSQLSSSSSPTSSLSSQESTAILSQSSSSSSSSITTTSLNSTTTEQKEALEKISLDVASLFAPVTLTLEGTNQTITAEKKIIEHSRLFEMIFKDPDTTSYALEKNLSVYDSLCAVTLKTLLEALTIIDNNSLKDTQEILATWIQDKDCISWYAIANYLDIPQLFDAAQQQLLQDKKLHQKLLASLFDSSLLTRDADLINVCCLPKSLQQRIKLPSTKLDGHENWICDLAWSPDGNYLAASDSNDTVRIWNMRTQKSRIIIGRYYWCKALAWSPDGKYIACGCDDGYVYIFDTQYGENVQSICGDHSTNSCKGIRAVAWSPNGKYLVFANNYRTIQIWEPLTKKRIKELPVGEKEEGDCCITIAWSPDNSCFATGSMRGKIILWDAQSFTAKQTMHDSSGAALIKWSPDGEYIAAGHDHIGTSTIELWDPKSGLLLNTITRESGLYDIAWSPDSKNLVIGSTNKTVQTINPFNGTVIATCKEHKAEVGCVAWSPNGLLIASADRSKLCPIVLTPCGTAYDFCHYTPSPTTHSTTEQKKIQETGTLQNSSSQESSAQVTVSLEDADQTITVAKKIIDHSNYINSLLYYSDSPSCTLAKKTTSPIYESLRKLTLKVLVEALTIIDANSDAKIAQQKLAVWMQGKDVTALHIIADFLDIPCLYHVTKNMINTSKK